MTTLSAADFAAKWQDNARRKRASFQKRFIDICRLLSAQTPAEADPSGEFYTFEAGAERLSTGNQGWADVWKRGRFGWEYKGDHTDLGAAFRQLSDYRDALKNPPALVVSDMDRIEVHANFTNTHPTVYEITLDSLAAGSDQTVEALRIHRAVMFARDELRSRQSAAANAGCSRSVASTPSWSARPRTTAGTMRSSCCSCSKPRSWSAAAARSLGSYAAPASRISGPWTNSTGMCCAGSSGRNSPSRPPASTSYAARTS